MASLVNAALTLIAVLSVASAAQAEPERPTLTLGFAEACPHMCPDDAQQGFTTDIARAVFEGSGYEVQFRALPWARAAAEARSGLVDGVLSAGKEETPGMIFPSEEIAVQSDCFMGLHHDSWTPGDAASFAHRRTIVFKGWVNEIPYRTALGEAGYDRAFINFSIDQNYTTRVVNMVKFGRADAFWMDINVFAYYQQRFPDVLDSSIKNLGCIKFQKLFVALTPARPEKSRLLGEQFDVGIRRLRSSGELQKIMQRYGLSDWR